MPCIVRGQNCGRHLIFPTPSVQVRTSRVTASKLSFTFYHHARLSHPPPARWYRPTQDRLSFAVGEPPCFMRPNPAVLLTVMWQSSGAGGGLGPLVNFYSKLPKGPAPASTVGGIKARYFDGKNASAAPVLFTILGIFGLGYTIDYQST